VKVEDVKLEAIALPWQKNDQRSTDPGQKRKKFAFFKFPPHDYFARLPQNLKKFTWYQQ